jgi:hypothetical protein
MRKPDLCETCGRVDPHLAQGVCVVCTAQHVTLTRERLLVVLAEHIGAERGVTIGRLVDEMVGQSLGRAEHASAERNVRELVVQLRLAGHHVCSHPSTGYYMAATPEELDAACSFLYDRAMTSLSQVAAMKRVSLPDLRGQLHLPT